MRPWGDLRPAAACVFEGYWLLPRVSRSGRRRGGLALRGRFWGSAGVEGSISGPAGGTTRKVSLGVSHASAIGIADAVGGARALSPRFSSPGRVVIRLCKGTALEEALDGLLVRETFSEAPAGCSATLLSAASLFAPLARGIVGGWSNSLLPCCHRGLRAGQGAPRLRFAPRVCEALLKSLNFSNFSGYPLRTTPLLTSSQTKPTWSIRCVS